MARFQRFAVVCSFMMLLALGGLAQGNGNAQNNGNGNGNNGWPQYWPNYVLTWLQQGGQLPQPMAMRVIHAAREWGQQECGLSQGQMVQRYAQGSLTIEFLQVAPPMLVFRVSYGGNEIVILQDNF